MANVTQSLFPAFGDMLSPSLEQTYAKQFELASRPGDSMQRVSGLISGAGEQFRQGVSGLFGQQPVEFAQRDKLRAITMGLQQQGVDVTTPEGMLQLAQTIEQFPEYAEGALRLRQQAAMMVQQRQQQALANRLTEAKIGTEGFRQTELATQAEKNLREPTAKEDKIKTSGDFAAAGISLGIPSKVNIADYTQDETASIRQQLQKDRESTARAGAPVPASGEVKIGDIASANTLVENLVKAPRENLSTVNQLRTLISQARKGEGAAVPQLQRQLVKLVGDSQIASAEARTALGSAGVVGDAFSYINTLFTGTPSAEKLNSVSKVIDALEQINANSYNQGRNRATALIGEAKFSPETRKSLIPPEYKTGKQREKSKFIEGQIYQDAKGNKARYVNGQWVPVQ